MKTPVEQIFGGVAGIAHVLLIAILLIAAVVCLTLAKKNQASRRTWAKCQGLKRGTKPSSRRTANRSEPSMEDILDSIATMIPPKN